MNNYNIDDLLTITIKRIGINGEGIGYYNKMAIFVENALIDEEVEVKITEVYPNRLVGIVENYITKSPNRIEPFCPKYNDCGGCQLQHLKYEETLKVKKEILTESLRKYYDKTFSDKLIEETIPSIDNVHYRNKASLPVKEVRGSNKVGIYKLGTNHFIEITDCPIQMKGINKVLNEITSLMDKHQVSGYDTKTRKGFVKALSVRSNQNETEIQVSFIMVRKANNLNKLVNELVSKNKEIVSVFMVINPEVRKQTFFTPEISKIYGKETINVSLDGFNFNLKPDAFFQLNYNQASIFYNKIKEVSDLKGKETVIDGFSGISSISHYLSSEAKKIFSIEIDKPSVESAKISLEENNIKNVNVIQGDFYKALSGLKKMPIDIAVFDPPRVGLQERVTGELKKYDIKKIVYGSCNPVTLAKDLKMLDRYKVIKILPLDMFPWTSHVESVVLLELKK